ncbi:Serine/threonine-protein kinase EDR1 [Heracleum sosnowskyi]|uniref:Serine/threonine-protein kinase EDR1 n=1 Tax=Heracleum sosnowskyi TaxID=360622 RepID=A0AAD8MWY4_9APIA|nr:Serine/threonine-protein kinase EDR1 [Heracleum sosnowskyi]
MTSEVPGTSGGKLKEYVEQADSNYGNNRVLLNISVQTGEEFSPEFLRDRVPPHGGTDVDQYKHKVGFYVDSNEKSGGSMEATKRRSLSSECMCDRATQSPTTPAHKSNSPFSYQSLSARKSGSPNSYQHTFGYDDTGVLDGNSFSGKMKFLCSYGGRILPRPNDGKLRYAGGETRIISFRKNVTYMELMRKTFAICNQPHTIKYQLPGEDLDALISVSSDEDLLLMIDEYHDLQRSSQRLRIFLVTTNDSENPCPCDTRTVQHTDADYQYVIAVNGMQDQSLHRSSSRESLTSYRGVNLDNSPKFRRESPTFHPREVRDGGSSMNGNMMLSNLNPQAYNSPHLRGKPLVHLPPFSTPMQVKTQNNSPMKIYEVDTVEEGYEGSTPCASNRIENDNIYCQNQDIYLTESIHNEAPLIDLDPSSPLFDQGGDMQTDNFMLDKLAIYSENFPFQNIPDLLSDSNLPHYHRKIAHLEMQHKDRPDYCLKKGIVPSLSNSELERLPSDATSTLSREWRLQQRETTDLFTLKASDASKTCIEWDQDMINYVPNKNSFFGYNQNVAETEASEVVQTYGVEPKMKLENVHFDPNLNNNLRKPSRDGSGNSLNLDKDDQTVINLSELSPVTDDVLAKVAYSYGHVGSSRQSGAEIKKSTIFVESAQLDNHDESTTLRMPVIVEDVTDNLPPDVPSASGVVPIVQDETSASDTESDLLDLDSDFMDPRGADKGESISDTVLLEMEAGIYNLQIIRNADLEELQELGSGTYGTVYHGKWRGTDVAIKRIKKSCFAGRSSEQERLSKDFWREAQILSKLHHPNVVAFYGVVPDGPEGTLATVTEFMVNGSLRHVLVKKDRALDRRKKLMIARDAAFGMEYLHMKNIVHFDLKCDNLLVNLGDPRRPICKVGDFGLSRIKRNTLVSGGVRGTLPWMAPELLNGSSSRVSEKVDVYSFGIAMWEILTGEEPYANMHCGAIIGGIVNNTLRPPIPTRCDAEWKNLMEECWSPDPASRPSFTEITNRLQVMSTAIQPKRHIPVKR